MDLVVRELTPELWPAFEELFDTTGPAGRCWCMYWRIGASYRRRPPEENRRALFEVVSEGPPPGLVALDNGAAVGWCQITPRRDLPQLDRAWRLKRVDEAPVWSISCFFVRRSHRRQGVTEALTLAAIERARAAGAPAVEAYPVDPNESPSSTHTGYVSTFVRLGFTEVARHVPARPIMRFRLAPGRAR